MNSLWKTDKYETDGCMPPKDIIEEQFRFLNDRTDGKVIGRVKEYEGEYQSKYETDRSLFDLTSPVYGVTDPLKARKAFDVQSVLGEQSEFVYEFYLTSVETPKYKYRIGIIDYSVLLYPAHLVLELSLAKEIGIDAEINIDNQELFIEILSKILNSKRVSSVIANLLRINGTDVQ
ncbi:MAG: hypothetical protein LUG99_07730 [Lachnospiraceae bacterium]|nr:hypothetical protein [Lachnospiraceae bacterium]